MNLIFPNELAENIIDLLMSFLQRSTLEVRKQERAKIMLMANQFADDKLIAKECNSSLKKIKKWKKRFLSFFKDRVSTSKVNLRNELLNLLKDAKRSGAPSTYKPAHICLIVSIALDKPELSGRPISHWTCRELADEANKRKITENISERTVSRILRHKEIKPHFVRYWLNPKIVDQDAHDQHVKIICDLYKSAESLAKNNTRIASMDEKCGMQILERAHPNKPVIKGSVEKIEHEYARNGTLTLIGSLDIASGKLIASSIGPTRNEIDFAKHVSNTINTAPDANWIFVMDQLNTHKSEELVKTIADSIGFKGDLGVKEKSGILKSMSSRMKFLTDKNHKIRIQYTPIHCSWLNQIEAWFSKLSRKVLRRGSFASGEKLTKAVENFIQYFNDTMAKPCKWTYSGK